MPYLNLDLDFLEHPQTLMLVGILGPGAEILPIRLWAHCGKFYSETGRLKGYSAPGVEAVLKWPGEPGKALTAMMMDGVDYLGNDEHGFYAKNWIKHQGHIHALKLRGHNMAKVRWDKIKSQADATGNAYSNAVGNAPSIRPSINTIGLKPRKAKCKMATCTIQAKPGSEFCPICAAQMENVND
jgi:hypothetical protein